MLADTLRAVLATQASTCSDVAAWSESTSMPVLAGALAEHARRAREHLDRLSGLDREGGNGRTGAAKSDSAQGGTPLPATLRPSSGAPPDELARHAYARAAVSRSGFELLTHVARAEDSAVSHAASSSAAESAELMRRMAGLSSRTVDASLRADSDVALLAQLRERLERAHAYAGRVADAVSTSRHACGDPGWRAWVDERLVAGSRSRSLLAHRAEGLGGAVEAASGGADREDGAWFASPGVPSDAASSIASGRAQPLAPAAFFGRVVPALVGMHHLAIAGHRQLARVAERAGDPSSREAVRRVLLAEWRAVNGLAAAADAALDAVARSVERPARRPTIRPARSGSATSRTATARAASPRATTSGTPTVPPPTRSDPRRRNASGRGPGG